MIQGRVGRRWLRCLGNLSLADVGGVLSGLFHCHVAWWLTPTNSGDRPNVSFQGSDVKNLRQLVLMRALGELEKVALVAKANLEDSTIVEITGGERSTALSTLVRDRPLPAHIRPQMARSRNR